MTDAPDKWIVINGMGGYICSSCGDPVESEPCAEHQPEAYARACSLVRYPVSMFERIPGCFACNHPKGIPVPFDEVSPADDLALCSRHWNWWVVRWLNADDEPPCSAHLIAADVEIGRRDDLP